jgi:hypothetical protein
MSAAATNSRADRTRPDVSAMLKARSTATAVLS